MNKTILGIAAAGSIIAGGTATQLNQPINTNFASTPTAFVTYVNGNEVDIAKNAPKVTMQEWNGQEQLGISAANTTTASAPVGLTSEVDNPIGNGQTVVMEPTSDGTGFNVDINLASKPSTNVFTYQLSGWQDMNFNYQPPLWQEIGLNAATSTCTDTDCIFPSGNFVHRPANVVGSYTVYSKTHRDHIIGQINYQTGKLFQIYRPSVTDSASSTTWAALDITNGVLTVTVPQSFLDTAVYPITVDPTFGYNSTPASSTCLQPGYVEGNYGAAPANGTISSISFYVLNSSTSPVTYNMGFYNGTTGGMTTFITSASGGTLSASQSAGWVTLSASASITSGNGYWFAVQTPTGYPQCGLSAFYDFGGKPATNSFEDGAHNTYNSWPNSPGGSYYVNSALGAYATYTVSGGATPPPNTDVLISNGGYVKIGQDPQVAVVPAIYATSTAGSFASRTTSFNWNLSCPSSGNNSMAVVMVAGDGAGNGAGGNITSVTVGGASTTQATYDSANYMRTSIWYLANPTAGTDSVVVYTSSSAVLTGAAYCLTGAAQGTPDASTSTGSAPTYPTTISTSITTVKNNALILDNISVGSVTQLDVYSSPSPGTQQFNIGNKGPSTVYYEMASQSYAKASPGAQTMSWSGTGPGVAGTSYSVISIAPATPPTPANAYILISN